jgi:hypothetical protein
MSAEVSVLKKDFESDTAERGRNGHRSQSCLSFHPSILQILVVPKEVEIKSFQRG